MKEATAGLVVILDDGMRVRFSLQKRDRDAAYFACFTGLDGKRLQRSTKETSQKRAKDAAAVVIREAFNPTPIKQRPTWDEAILKLRIHTKAANLRSGTVDQYVFAIRTLRKSSNVESPADVTPQIAERFKIARIELGRKPRTVAGNIDNLRIVYGHWWKDTCRILDCNPFENVKPPKDEKQAPRIVTPDELKQLLDWFKTEWAGFRLPVLLLEVKARIGCRIGELCSAETPRLADGRIGFAAETTKGRKERRCKLPPELFDELHSIAGPQFVFERFADELRGFHRQGGRRLTASNVGDFSPERLKVWLQHQLIAFRKATNASRFKLHNLRGTAMSRARTAGIQIDDASIAFGCNPQTMRQHYLNLDETRIADDVFNQI